MYSSYFRILTNTNYSKQKGHQEKQNHKEQILCASRNPTSPSSATIAPTWHRNGATCLQHRATLGSRGVNIEPKWNQHGAKLIQNVAKLGQAWGQVGPTWGQVVPHVAWCQVAPTWGQVGPTWSRVDQGGPK